MVTFNDLPLELQDEIFIMAIRLRPYCQIDAQLPAVSRRVQACVEPVLYETMKTYRATQLAPRNASMLDYALECKSTSFLKRHVKNLIMAHHTLENDLVDKALSKCQGVRNLCIWAAKFDVGAITSLNLRYFQSYLRHIRALAQLNHSFPNLVQLTIYRELDDYDDFPELHWLPALRKVEYSSCPCKYDMILDNDIAVILGSAKHIEKIVVECAEDSCLEEKRDELLQNWEGDKRVVLCPKILDFEHWEETIPDIIF